MSLVITVPYGLEKSGIIIFAERLKNEFISQGIDTKLITLGLHNDENHQSKISLPTKDAIIDWCIKNSKNINILFWAGFYEDLESIKNQILCSVLLRKAKTKVFFLWERTGYEEVVPDRVLLYELIQSASDGIVVLNEYQYRDISIISPSDHSIYLSSPGVDTRNEFVPPTIQEKIGLRDSIGWPIDKIIALWLGRFEIRKRPDLLVRTWLEDSSLEAKAQLVLVGSGFGQESSIENELLDLTRSITSISIVKYYQGLDRSQFYRAADFFITLGIVEGEPSVLSEAMACGLPVIASNIDGHKRLVVHNRTGVIFKPDDGEQLHILLHEMIDNPQKRMLLGLKARKLSVRTRDISVVANGLMKFFFSNITKDC